MAEPTLKVPSAQAVQQAQAALRALAALPLRKRARGIRIRARPEGGGDGVSVTVPREAFELFLEVLRQTANGNAVTIVPVHAELTTQQAADHLTVSRPFLIGLLESGKLPFRLVGSHRRVRFADLMAYKDADDKRRRDALDALTEEGQKLGFGY